jgi:hypothetical protein
MEIERGFPSAISAEAILSKTSDDSISLAEVKAKEKCL